MIRIRLVYVMYLFKAVGIRYNPQIRHQGLCIGSGELRQHPEHDVGEDLVTAGGAAVRLNLYQLYHLPERA